MLIAAAGAARAQDSPTLRPRGASEPIPKTDAPSDTTEEAAPDVRALAEPEELPQPLARVAPVYPEAARTQRIQGTVVLTVTVRADGSVAQARVKRSIPALDVAALDAVGHWTWRPGRRRGKAAELDVSVPIRFLLAPDPEVDWHAERRVAAALEHDGRIAEAFDRYAFAIRALPAAAPAESLDALRRDVLRVHRQLAPEAISADANVVPVEAWIHFGRADSLGASGDPEDRARAIHEYQRALVWAPWHSAWYLSLGKAQAAVRDYTGARRSVELYRLGDLPDTELARVDALIERLRAAAGGR